MTPARLILLVALSFLGSGCAGFSTADRWTDRIDAMVPALLERDAAPGLSIAIVERGRIVYARGFGYADVAARAPVTADTIFNVASVAKPVTTIGVLRLSEAGRLNLDASAVSLITRGRILDATPNADEITIRRVLQHRAGLSMPSVPWVFDDQPKPTLRAVLEGTVEGTEGLTRTHPIGEFNYSGGGFALLQLMIGDQTGQAFEDYMKAAVFTPLGMTRTAFARPTATEADSAVGYYDNGRPVRSYQIVGSAAGGLYTTASDLAAFAAAYSRSPGRSTPFVTEGMIAEIVSDLTPLRYPSVPPEVFGGAVYGAGHGVHRTRSGEILLYHSGGNPGFLAYFIVEPGTGRAIVALANSENAKSMIDRVRAVWGERYGYDLPKFY